MTDQTSPAVAEPGLAPPSRLALLLEVRAVLDALAMITKLARSRLAPARSLNESAPILLLPGFGTDGRYFLPLRRYLRRLGYTVEDWGLGTNRAGLNYPHTQNDLSDRWDFEHREEYRQEASVPYLCDKMAERTRARFAVHGRKLTLVGWSLGGYVAREVARDLPDMVAQVITFGSPTIGGPKYTAAAGLFRQRGMDIDWIEAEIGKRDQRRIAVPVTTIFSRSDGIVSWRAALDTNSVNARHVEVRGAHMGMGFSPAVWHAIVAALESPPVGRQEERELLGGV